MRKLPTVLFLLVCLVMAASCSESEQAANTEEANLAANQFNFELERSRVILPVSVNGSRPLRVILDSGMPFDGVYMFHKELEQELQLATVRDVQVPGAGDGEASQAKQFIGTTLTMGEMAFDSQMVIIAQSGGVQSFPTDGVLGYTLFGHYAVEVDCDRMVITLHDPEQFAPDDSWTVLNMTFNESGIAFVDAVIAVTEGEEIPMSLYLDIASGDALELLIKDDQKFTLPDNLEEKYLGTGLSGDIHGYEGMIAKLKLGPFELTDVVTAFAPTEIRSRQEGADGILAHDALRRFNVIYDWTGKRLCLKPNKSFDEPFVGL